MSEISKTGYWAGETAHIHHVHSEPLSKWIVNYFSQDKKKRIWDLGCGLGNYLKDLKDAGFQNCIGIEGDIPSKSVFQNILKYDITNPIRNLEKGNVICLEVLEHIPEIFMDRVLRNINHLCNDILILSWAVRGQPGFGHVNCKDNHEVIPLIEKMGFMLLEQKTDEARKVIDETTPWFKNTLLIFKRIENENKI